eukprot:217159_1
MTKTSLVSVAHRRLILTTTAVALFIVYLIFNIDFLLEFDIDNDVELQNLEIIIQTTPPTRDKHASKATNKLSRFERYHTNHTTSEELKRFGFDRKQWFFHQFEPSHCPYFENICVHKQHFYVSNPRDQFTLHPDSRPNDWFGNVVHNSYRSFPIYAKIFEAQLWDKATNEYEMSHCIHDDNTPNHIILSFNYMSMIGEFYLRILTLLHYIFNTKQMMDKTDRNYKFYLMLPEAGKILLSHRLFMEPFTKFELLQFTNLFDRYRCKCYQRLFFCGFNKYRFRENDTTFNRYLRPQSKEKYIGIDRVELFKDMIDAYQSWINQHYIQIQQDVLNWKQQKLNQYFGKYRTDIKDATKWRFIGLYQRKKRRKWMNIRHVLKACNSKYNEQNILCVVVDLEGFLHAKDIIIMHRSMMMLVGIHGATLTSAVWMENKQGNYVIELLPHAGPEWTTSLDKPSMSGVLFWESTYNYVGLKLSNHSGINTKSNWADMDFIVEPHRLLTVIDFLIVDDGGYCAKFKRADKIQVPQTIKKMGFAIYNAYCPQTPDIIHQYVKKRMLDVASTKSRRWI